MVKKIFLKILLIFLCCALFASCVSTYNTTSIDVVSDSKEDSSIHYIKTTENVVADNSLDGKLIAYYTLGAPFVLVGCTIRETGRVLGYSALNILCGFFAYRDVRYDHETTTSWVLPDTKKAKADYDAFQEEYKKSDLYKYRKYRGVLSRVELTKNDLVEEVNWNNEAKVISSTTETIKVQTKVGDSASRLSKKASLIGCRIGRVTAKILGIPSYIIGFIIGAAADENNR